MISNALGSGLSFFAEKIKEAVSELKEVDTILTEISLTNDSLSKSERKALKNKAFDTAGKYGRKASDYLTGIKEASNAGYGNANEIAKGLLQYKQACHGLGVSLTETKNGILALHDPMDVLKELSDAYNKLGENDKRKTNLLDSIGSGSDGAQLDALLSQWGTYEAMLQQYADGSTSMAVAA